MADRPDRYSWWVVASLVLIGLGGSGCSSMSWGRPKVAPGVRTITSVGDTPQSVVAGMPGASYGSGPILVERSTGRDGQISGRVVDERGRPVPNVEVRVADGAISAGRDLSTRSDDAGGFTLRGLRADKSYTIIASAEAGRHSLSGRERILAPESGVAIVLRSDASSSSLARRPEPATPRRDVDENLDRDTSDRVVVRTRDSRPVDDEPELDRRLVQREAEPNTADFWRSIDQAPTSYGMPLVDSPEEREPTRPQSGRSVMGLPFEEEDEEWNPLPPARERPPATAPPAGSDFEVRPRPGRSAQTARPEPFVSGDGPLVPSFGAAGSASAEDAVPPSGPEESPAPETNRGMTPESNEAPSVPPPSAVPEGPLSPDELDAEFPPAAVEPSQEPTPIAESPEVKFPAAAPASDPEPVSPSLMGTETSPDPVSFPVAPLGDPDPEVQPLPDTPRASWSDLTSRSQAKRSSIYPPSVRRLPSPGVRSLAMSSAPTARGDRDSDITRASVRYDNRAKRLVEFTLADLDGYPVRFSDIDADFILLDFWGTWCGPCAKTMPHLVGLQNQYDPRRLRVVGIAYERGPQPAQVDAVRRMASRQRINYPLLLAEQDGKPCPLVSAFQVDKFPTLILLDRQGRILWRDSGSSDAMLQRLDRVIEAQTRRLAGVDPANANVGGIRRR